MHAPIRWYKLGGTKTGATYALVQIVLTFSVLIFLGICLLAAGYNRHR